jgi:Na+-translocating ferredoxin:NAD+ oxidoreductase RnfC subunit
MIDAHALPRLLLGAGARPLTLKQHEEAFTMNARPGTILEHLEASGLRGRGGASFPTFQKVALLRAQRSHHKFVVVNAMEGEPAAHKDQTLLSTNPHLVLDGAEFLAGAIGADKIAVCVSRDNPAAPNSNYTRRRGVTSPAKRADSCTGSTTTNPCPSTDRVGRTF